MNNIDRHHILFPNRLWNQYDSSKKLRETPELIIPMYRNYHNQIHNELEQIPLLDTHMLDFIRSNYKSVRNRPIESIYALQTVIHEASYGLRTSLIAQKMGELVVRSLEIQLPMIKKGIAIYE